MNRWIALLLLVLVVAGVTGCASNEPDDVSARPWNTPRHWETGLPAGMYERR